MKSLSNIFSSARVAHSLLGSNIIWMFALTVPIGLATGAGEILFGAALYEMVIYFGIIPQQAVTNLPIVLANYGNPVTIIIILSFVLMVFRFFGVTLPSYASEALGERVRKGITDDIMAGAEERTNFSVSDVSHILSNLSPNMSGFLFCISRFVVDICFLAIILLGLLVLSPTLTFITAVLGVIIIAPLILMRGIFSSYSKIMHEDISFFTHRIIKDVKNIHFLKVTGMNEGERQKIKAVSARFFGKVLGFRTLMGIYSVLPQFLGVIAGISVIYASQMFEFKELSGLVPFMYLLTRITGAVSTLSGTVAQLHASKPYAMEFLTYADRFSTYDKDGSDKKSGINNLAALHVRDLEVGRTDRLLSNLTFSASRGQTLLITGESGRGKTTLLMTLIGLVRRLSGDVSWNGIPLDSLKPEDLRQFVGYAGPDPYLVNGSIRDNIIFGVEEDALTDATIREALWCANAEFVETLDGGLSHQLSEDGDGVSAGQKQRLTLARALLRKPDLLLLDEATANIDEAMEEEIMIRIRNTFPDIIIIAVSHRSSMKKFATEQICI